MTITVDWANKVIESTASITDAVVLHSTLRDLEDDATGAIYPVTHTWKALDLGGGAFFYQLDLINGYQFKFPSAGNYSVIGNINGTIIPVGGVYVERKTSAAYVTTAVGGSGPSVEDIVTATWASVLDTPFSSGDLLRLIAAMAAGKVSGARTGTETFRSVGDSKDRIIASVDASGNRTAIVLDAS